MNVWNLCDILLHCCNGQLTNFGATVKFEV